MSPRESNQDRLTCSLRGREAIGRAAEAAREFGGALGLGATDLARLCIVIEELIANLYDHGGLSGDDVVELILERDPNGIRASIRDPGRPFNPWEADHRVERKDRSGGGGIDLVRAWAKCISYRPSSEGNHMEILVPVQAQD